MEECKLKRYLVFSGSHCYPLGGWSDFKQDFDNELEAIGFAKGLVAADKLLTWAHVLDLETLIVGHF